MEIILRQTRPKGAEACHFRWWREPTVEKGGQSFIPPLGWGENWAAWTQLVM